MVAIPDHARYTQQAIWTRPIRKFLLDKLEGFPLSPSILEVGSGTGAILIELEQPPSGLHGLDISFPSLAYSKGLLCPEVSLCTGDGGYLPYQDGIFDLVYCHFLLLWLKNPQLVLEEMSRVLKPGGSLMCFAEPDYGGRLAYPPPLDNLGQLQINGLIRQGADPFIGRKMATLAEELPNCIIHRTGILGQDSPHPTEADQLFWESEWEMLESDIAPLINYTQLSDLRNAFFPAVGKSQRTLFVPTFYMHIKKM